MRVSCTCISQILGGVKWSDVWVVDIQEIYTVRPNPRRRKNRSVNGDHMSSVECSQILGIREVGVSKTQALKGPTHIDHN